MKVAHVITDLNRGGAETALSRLLATGSGHGRTPAVIVLGNEGVLSEEVAATGAEVIHLGMSPGRPSASSFMRLSQYLHAMQPDLVQGWMIHGNLTATLAKTILPRRVPVLWNIRHALHDLTSGSRKTAMLIRWARIASHTPARILYNSQASERQHAAIGYHAANATVIPNGFDCDAFRPDPEARRDVRLELGLSTATPVVGLVARYHPVKGHGLFLEAAGRLAARASDVHFVLAGQDVTADNPAFAALSSDLRSRVHLLGPRRDVRRVMAALDMLVVSSHSEAFPNVVGEAMACGVPCVVTDVGDAGWLVGETGRVVPPGQPEALAEAMADLLSCGAAERRSLSLAARRRIETEFSLQTMVDRYMRLYDEVLTERIKA